MKIKVYFVVNFNEGEDKFKEKFQCKYHKIEEFNEKVVNEVVGEASEDLYIDTKTANVDVIINFVKKKNGEKGQGKKYYIINLGETYILNKCFQDTGYATFGRNVSHEAINKFQADSKEGEFGVRYFFLCSNGKVDSVQINNTWYVMGRGELLFPAENASLISFSKYETEEKGKNKYTFIQKAEKLELVNPGCSIADKIKEEKNITYNGIAVRDIFSRNAYNKEKGIAGKNDTSNEDKFPCVTFKLAQGGQVKRPKTNRVFNYETIVGAKLAKSSMRQFVFKGTKMFEEIEKILPPDNEWEEDKDTSKELNQTYDENESVLSVIGRERRETYFSALIAYAFQESPAVLKSFLKKDIGEEDDIGEEEDIGEYKVYCEENNVDILVRSKNKIIIIENKIDAEITEGQKKKWEQFISDKKKDKDDDLITDVNEFKFTPSGRHSQLEKYYRLALYYANLERNRQRGNLKETAIKSYILCPEYRKEEYKTNKGKYTAGDKYEVKSYAELDSCLEKMDASLRDDAKEIIIALKRAIQPHTKNQNTYYMEQACGRFINRIKELKL